MRVARQGLPRLRRIACTDGDIQAMLVGRFGGIAWIDRAIGQRAMHLRHGCVAIGGNGLCGLQQLVTPAGDKRQALEIAPARRGRILHQSVGSM